MADLVADTHAMVWCLSEPERLSPTARAAFAEAAAAGDRIYLSAISLVEVLYLTEKGRLAPAVSALLREAIAGPDHVWLVTPVDRSVADCLPMVLRDAVPDMPDRIIAATARHLGLPLVTCDEKIRASGLDVIW